MRRPSDEPSRPQNELDLLHQIAKDVGTIRLVVVAWAVLSIIAAMVIASQSS